MDTFENKTVAIIGVGHMGGAIVDGFLQNKNFDLRKLFLANPSIEKLTRFQQRGIRMTTDNKDVAMSDYIFLCIKPKLVQQVAGEISNYCKKKILISAAAGVTVDLLLRWTRNPKQKVVRIMPNLPVANGEGVIGFYANTSLAKGEKETLKKLFSLLGIVVEVQKEDDLNTLTVLSGSGPAVVAYFIDALTKTARQSGLSESHARAVALQTFTGTLSYMREKKLTAQELIKAVATKGGITEEIIRQFEKEQLAAIVGKGLRNGREKIASVTKNLSSE